MPRTAIVICTYNRPLPLKRAVESARAQALPPGYEAEVLVVDNSPEGNARQAIASMAEGPGLPLRYLGLPQPGVSQARNAGVAATRGETLIFLDDDQWFDPGCVAALLATAEESGADMVFGPVLPDFPGGAPSWDPTGHHYRRLVHWPTGTTMPLGHSNPAGGRWIATGNLLLRRATCLAEPVPFDPSLGICGGEDYDLFVRLHRQGRRMVWCAEAVAHEEVPEGRTRLGYFRRRSFHAGKLYGMVTLRHSACRPCTALNLTARALAQCGVAAARWAGAVLTRETRAERHSVKLAEVAGKLVWWSLSRRSPW
ncbi:glycosyltransferase family 2 protein [Pseudoroseomonas cervicalis]|uniref:glycosyltransferase family 2 protein n=1 Tax=Teichococcus cervicalis TaxID=204525 RepID=UPI0022F16A95|nr:glycosyltransferase family 2 protein [Pseudoroseomonas cervicalis]WBV43316.1 glycosyltransferase family 2 protein [Pseudoroseomonas cervicalis]